MAEGGGSDVWRYILSVDGRDLELTDGEVTLGRSRTSTVRVDHESVSRSHALLTFERGQAVLKDLNSSNGTYVGGRRVLNETRVTDGDRIQLGAAVIAFRLVPPAGPSDRTAMMGSEVKGAVLPPPRAPELPAGGRPEDEPSPRPGFRDDEDSVPLGERPPGLRPPAPPLEPPALPPPSAYAGQMEMSAAELVGDLGSEDDTTGRSRAPHMGLAAQALEAVRSTTKPPEPVPPALRPPPVPDPVPPPQASEPPPERAAPPPAPAPPPGRGAAPPPPRRPGVASRVVAGDPTLSQIPIQTAAAPAGDAIVEAAPRNLADFLPRFLAFLVDSVILTAVDLLLMSPVFLLLFFKESARLDGPNVWMAVVSGLCAILILAANLGYLVGGWARSGRTPGKSLLGLAIVTGGQAPGAGLGWSVAFLRVLGMIVSGLPCGIGFVAPLLRQDRRAFHDLIAGTWVVRIR